MSPCHHVSTGLPAYSWTRRLVAAVCVGSALNQINPPLGSRIIGPLCPGPEYGATNISPGATAGELAVTVTVGGRRSGRERNTWTSLELALWIVSGVVVSGS